MLETALSLVIMVELQVLGFLAIQAVVLEIVKIREMNAYCDWLERKIAADKAAWEATIVAELVL